jgi:PTS system cellobiose-specific IIB component
MSKDNWNVGSESDTKEVKVLIFCAAGMSSSLLIRALHDAGQEVDLNIEVIAHHSFGSAYWDFAKSPVDVVLVAPQIRFLRRGIEKLASAYGIPVVVIEPTTYGMADGDKLLLQVMSALDEISGTSKELGGHSGDRVQNQ